MLRRFLLLALSFAAANAFAQSAGTGAAQAYPAKPVRLVVGWPPGGAADGVARPLAAKLSDALGRPVVVDNRGGATGTIGASVVAKAPADGYTLLLGTSNEMVLNPYEKMPYNTIEDFAPISMVISFPSTLVVHPSIPVKSVQQFVAFMRARPGKLNFATTGSGHEPSERRDVQADREGGLHLRRLQGRRPRDHRSGRRVTWMPDSRHFPRLCPS